MHHPDETASARFNGVDLNGKGNDGVVWGQFVIGADDNGDVEYDANATGAGTMDVHLLVNQWWY